MIDVTTLIEMSRKATQILVARLNVMVRDLEHLHEKLELDGEINVLEPKTALSNVVQEITKVCSGTIGIGIEATHAGCASLSRTKNSNKGRPRRPMCVDEEQE